MKHHTKDKGDVGLTKVIADLTLNGICVAIPISEHQPYDCIAVSESGQMSRISVKYKGYPTNGRIQLRMRSSRADKKGIHIKQHTGNEYDAIAVYCKSVDRVMYVSKWEFFGRRSLSFDPDSNDYLDPTRIWSRSIDETCTSKAKL